MYNAKFIPLDSFYKPKSTKYAEICRMYQGVPTIAVTPKGRIFLGWHAGGLLEPSMYNYNVFVYSDDDGATWSEPLLVTPSSTPHEIHVVDAQLFIDPEGILHLIWVQDNVKLRTDDHASVKPSKRRFVADCNYYYTKDLEHSCWEMLCLDPDAEEPVFTQPKYIHSGFLTNRPLFLTDKHWLSFAYGGYTDQNSYEITYDGGKSYTRRYSGKKWPGPYDEGMGYKMEDGTIRLFIRNNDWHIAETFSHDNGESFEDCRLTDIPNANSKFHLTKLPSGRVMLIHNNHDQIRKDMTVRLSEDDGKTWKYSLCIDPRVTSYPDAQYHNGRIYLSYDCGRTKDREIVFCTFTEEDVFEGREIKLSTVSKPAPAPNRTRIGETIERTMLIPTLPYMEKEALLAAARAFYDAGVKLLAVRFPGDLSVSDEKVGEAIKELALKYGNSMYIGGANVLTTEQARRTRIAGGVFAICPNVDKEVVFEICNIGMLCIAGAFTQSEIREADRFCSDFVSLYPATSLDAEKLLGAGASMPSVKMIAYYTDKRSAKMLSLAGATAFIYESDGREDKKSVSKILKGLE